jgi:hypothetical protein
MNQQQNGDADKRQQGQPGDLGAIEDFQALFAARRVLAAWTPPLGHPARYQRCVASSHSCTAHGQRQRVDSTAPVSASGSGAQCRSDRGEPLGAVGPRMPGPHAGFFEVFNPLDTCRVGKGCCDREHRSCAVGMTGPAVQIKTAAGNCAVFVRYRHRCRCRRLQRQQREEQQDQEDSHASNLSGWLFSYRVHGLSVRPAQGARTWA